MTQFEIESAYKEADKRMKATNGHMYITILKTRCQNCGRSPKQKGKCTGWFRTFISHLTTVLMQRDALSRGESR